MSSTVKKFSVGYYPINQYNVFTSGDYIRGQVTLELAKDCKVFSLYVTLKGKAEVSWTDYYKKKHKTYNDKVTYFKKREFIIEEDNSNSVIDKGCHGYQFTIQIPEQDLPSSFKGSYGQIEYLLEATLARSMRAASKAKTRFTLLHKGNLYGDPSLMTPQQNMTEKTMNLFSSGKVDMDVNLPRTGFHQEEGMQVVASIQNRSSRDIKPKYCLYAKYSYFAKTKRKVQTEDILRKVGDPIPPSTSQTVTRIITIPPTTCASILNCNILKVEYRLRVYLDVKYGSDPEIKFPIVILPASQRPEGEYQSARPTSGFGAFGGSDMHGGSDFLQNPTASEPSAPPPSYDTYEMYPRLNDVSTKS